MMEKRARNPSDLIRELKAGYLIFFTRRQAEELAGLLDIADSARTIELRDRLDHAANWYLALKNFHAPRRKAQRKAFDDLIKAADHFSGVLSQLAGAGEFALVRTYAGHQTPKLDDDFPDLNQRWQEMDADVQAFERLRFNLPRARKLLPAGKGQPTVEPLRNLAGRLAFVAEHLTGSDYHNSKRKHDTQARKFVESSILMIDPDIDDKAMRNALTYAGTGKRRRLRGRFEAESNERLYLKITVPP